MVIEYYKGINANRVKFVTEELYQKRKISNAVRIQK